MPVKPSYNRIFESFVPPGEHGDRISGLVAYSLYKVEKREWAAEIWRTENRGPTADELAQFIRTCTPSRLEGWKQQADNALASFGDSVIEDATPQIREDALRGTTARAISTSMVANFLYTLLLIFVSWILYVGGVDIIGFFKKFQPPNAG